VKTGAIVHGVRVVGRADEATLRRVVGQREIKLVVLATPTAPGSRTREIAKICRQLGVQTKTIPSLADRVQGELSFSAIREVAIEDLLRRDPVQLDVAQVAGFLDQRSVLVTGAGGSIGSELARQVLRFRPRTLVLLDHDENALYHIERELCGKHPDLAIHIVVGDILDRERIDAVFRRHRPAVVLHAAAHKHVPLMEQNSVEAVKNNIFGTMNVADAAHVYSADAFVLISTDKAVNPTSVMGATKRVAEIAVQSRAGQSRTRFVAVRFGNVLGSSGSVVPLFREQIAHGGPVTVTHPDMRRYFMTIQEATQLVLQAGALGSGGEIFLLDMGEPVKIVDLARDLIELSGLQPDVDIAIEFAGVRPGEKLFEELLAGGEAYDQTPHPKIVLGRIQPTPADMVKRGLASLQKAVAADDEQAIRSVLSQWVPGATLSTRKSGEGPAMQIVALERSSQPA
jgi:FlaA1/EpsC-like NDP-sugar epimerase